MSIIVTDAPSSARIARWTGASGDWEVEMKGDRDLLILTWFSTYTLELFLSDIVWEEEVLICIREESEDN